MKIPKPLNPYPDKSEKTTIPPETPPLELQFSSQNKEIRELSVFSSVEQRVQDDWLRDLRSQKSQSGQNSCSLLKFIHSYHFL